jgi:hypothetical protein
MGVYAGFYKAAGCFRKLNEALDGAGAQSPATQAPRQVVTADPAPSHGKIGALIEDHFDPTEYREFNKYFPQQGYEVEYVTRLWGNRSFTFGSNPEGEAPNQQVKEPVTVTKGLERANPAGCKGPTLIGASAMDWLR